MVEKSGRENFEKDFLAVAERDHRFRSNAKTLFYVTRFDAGDGISIKEDVFRILDHPGFFIRTLTKDADDLFFVPQDDLPLFGLHALPAHPPTELAFIGNVKGQHPVKTVKVGHGHQDAGAHLGHKMGVHHEVISGKSALNGPFQVLGKGALKPETVEKPIIGLYPLGDRPERLALSHLSKVLSFVLVEAFGIGQVPAVCDQCEAE
jgi:hypothetical protein